MTFTIKWFPKFNIVPEKMMVGRLLSYWEDNFSGAMLNFGRVHGKCNSSPSW